MCRNIRTLFNIEPPATELEIRFDVAVADAARRLIRQLNTQAAPRDRETEAAKARQRARRRFAQETS